MQTGNKVLQSAEDAQSGNPTIETPVTPASPAVSDAASPLMSRDITESDEVDEKPVQSTIPKEKGRVTQSTATTTQPADNLDAPETVPQHLAIFPNNLDHVPSAGSSGSSNSDSEDDEPIDPEKAKIPKGKAPIRSTQLPKKEVEPARFFLSNGLGPNADADESEEEFFRTHLRARGTHFLHIDFDEQERKKQTEREQFYRKKGFSEPPFVVSSAQINAWRRYHVQKVIDAVLNNRVNDLKALIDIKFIEEIYEQGREALNQKRENLINRKIMAEEKIKLLENWCESTSNLGGDEGSSWESCVGLAQFKAKKRMLDDFIEDLHRVDNLNTAQRNEAERQHTTIIDALIATDPVFSSMEPIANLEKVIADLKVIVNLIADSTDSEGNIIEGELGELENKIASMRDFFYPLQDRVGVLYKRYFEFIMPRVNEQIEAEHEDDYDTPSDIPYVMPEPYRSFLAKFNDAKDLNDLAEKYPVPPGDIDNNNEDLNYIRNTQVAMSGFENEIEKMGMVGSMQSNDDSSELSKHKERLEREIQNCKTNIRFAQDAISKRFQDVALSIFIEIFCRHYVVFISPNYLFPHGAVEENNRVMIDRWHHGGEGRNDHEIVLNNGNSLLLAAVKRKYYPMAAFLLLCGADPTVLNKKEISVLNLLEIDDIAGLGVLAIKIGKLIQGTYAESDVRAQEYRDAREAEYIKHLEYQEENFKEYQKQLETRKARHQHTFAGNTDELAKEMQKRLATDLRTLGNVQSSDIVWGGLRMRFNWYFSHGVYSFFEIIQRTENLRNDFRELLEGLRNLEAVGHDNILVERLTELKRICMAINGYEDFVLKISQLLQKVGQPASTLGLLGQNALSHGNVGSNLPLVYVRRREDIKDIAVFPKVHKRTREEVWAMQQGMEIGRAEGEGRVAAAEAKVEAAEAKVEAAEAKVEAAEAKVEAAKAEAAAAKAEAAASKAKVAELEDKLAQQQSMSPTNGNSASAASQSPSFRTYQNGGGESSSRSTRAKPEGESGCTIS